MENAAYVSPPPLPPQAHLSAAFQAAVTSASAVNPTAFQEALMSRMGRPFGLTVRKRALTLVLEVLESVEGKFTLVFSVIT